MGIFGFGKKEAESVIENKPAEFCMWKPTKGDISFKKSHTIELIDYIFDLVDGYELLAFNGLSILSGKRLESIPEKETFLTMKKDATIVLISLSKEKGLRFYFDYNRNSAKEIQNILRNFIDMFMQSGIPPYGIPSRASSQTNGRKWWQQMKVVISKQPEQEIKAIGMQHA
ncbi:hypothetical protein HYU16_03905 [Candidatus Woesearchaeota archaeon]|nr:hypothetical protein [Candidatus Woesearchaeota archaeon]